MAVRVRFAPSPTGYLHLGGLRTALFNYLFAASKNGKLILRVEDTDQERYVDGVIDKMMNTFNWLGIHFNEGPSPIGGAYGPYVQSERAHLYQQYNKELIKRGAAYHCFCTKERINLLRTRGGYDGLCRDLSQSQVEEKLNQGLPHVTRLKVDKEGTTVVEDTVYGSVPFANEFIDDQVLIKTNGLPTYHLANVVDDHLMEISHVLRGEEWLSSTCKHMLLYKALGWPTPVYVHLPILLSWSGGKLSKRKDSVYVHEYQERGFLPEALINFISLMGWNPKTSQEIFSLEELAASFNLEGINKSPGVVDEKKLCWFNGQHANVQYGDSHKMKHFVDVLRNCLLKDKDMFNISSADDDTVSSQYLSQVILLLVQDSFGLIPNIPYLAPYFWNEPDLTTSKPPPANYTLNLLEELLLAINSEEDLSLQRLSSLVDEVADKCQLTNSNKVLSVLRYALAGGKPGPSVVGVASILGKSAVCRRLLVAKQHVETLN